jgi:hypothetical protein
MSKALSFNAALSCAPAVLEGGVATVSIPLVSDQFNDPARLYSRALAVEFRAVGPHTFSKGHGDVGRYECLPQFVSYAPPRPRSDDSRGRLR